MKKSTKTLLITTLIFFGYFNSKGYPLSTRHHVMNMGKNLVKFTCSPAYGIFVKGPKNIKEAYQYEVWGREKLEKRGLLRYKIFALWRVPGEEIKGIVDGLVDSGKTGGEFIKEFISIFFSD